MADPRALGHAQEHRPAPRVLELARGPVDKGLMNVMRGNRGADGIKVGAGQIIAPNEVGTR